MSLNNLVVCVIYVSLLLEEQEQKKNLGNLKWTTKPNNKKNK